MFKWFWTIFSLGAPDYVNLKQAVQKLETELLFLKDVNVRDWNLQFKEWYFESLQQRFCTQNKTKKNRQIVFPYGNKIYIQSRLNLKGWEWRWFLRKVRDLKLL